jgi:translocation and assembly module TamB
MTRRRFIAVISLCMLVVLGVIGLGIVLVATKSDRGQAALRKWVEDRVASSMHGKIHIGRVSGNFLTGVTIDSLELRDDQDSLFVATGRVQLEYDPRDLVDRRLHFRNVDVLHPTVILRQHENWTWNFKRMFSFSGPRQGNGPERGFGDFIVIDSTHIRDASFRVTIPWHADDSLHGARKDSAIKANIGRNDHEIRRTAEGLTQTYRWTNAYAAVPYIRIADPDSVGKLFVIDTLHATETVPPFSWRNVSGVVRLNGDTVWMKAPHFDLPGSTGHGEGRVWWGSDLPVRYAVRIWGDSVSLKDVAWVYPTLPTTGGGKMILDIRNEPNLNKLDYALSDMDVRTTKSRLRGSMTFEVGGPVLTVHDVKVTADPVDWDLLRTLNGKPFPADWQGKLTGTVTARGGPLTHFYVDAADMTFTDAHVRGAVSRMKGHGELDILLPAFTAFHHFTASTERMELRTLSAIYPAFPKITGYVSGSAVLDSSWLDVRVSNAQLTHVDGPAEPTKATGGGRITYGTKYMVYDLDLLATPLSLTTLARSYPKMSLRGTFNGPIKVKGIAPDLAVTADVTGPAGHITYAGRVDADSVGGYGANGSGTFDALNAAMLVGLASPPSRLAGTYDVDVVGDSLATLAGPLAVRLGRSEVDGLLLSGANARMRFDNGIVRFDTLVAEGAAGALTAHGTLGLTRSAGRDSLTFAMTADSLGGLRQYLPNVTLADGTPVTGDSLRGRLAVRGTARGWLDSLDLRGTLTASGLMLRSNRARAVRGTLAVQSVHGHTVGGVDLRADSMVAGGLRVELATLDARLLDKGRARFTAAATTDNGTSLRAAGDYRAVGDTTSVQLDTLNLAIKTARWALRRSTHLVSSPAGVLVDTLVLADATGARITGTVRVPDSAPARATLRGDSLPLADLANLAQLGTSLGGRLSFDVDVAGTRLAPTMTWSAMARGLQVGAYTAEAVSLTGGYERARAALRANLVRDGHTVLDASLDYPIALTLFSARSTGDSLHGRVHADSVDLALIQTLAPQVKNASGKAAIDLAISGQPAKPHVGGRVALHNGAVEVPDAGLKLSSINALLGIDAANDSLTIDQATWVSPVNGGSGALQGNVVFRDLKNPKMDLRLDMRALRAVDKRNLARLDVSTTPGGLTLVGTLAGATMSGGMTVDRGTIFIPELIGKQLEELSIDDFAALFDTTDVRNRSIMPKAPGVLVEHLRLNGVSVNLGDDVWLKSKEASIKLGGSLNVTRARDDRESSRSFLARDAQADSERYVLALSGTLSADRGTYALALGPVQREFQVQSGRITFFGTPDFNPEIDVSALYNVKQSNRADIAVQARIFGNFYPQPTLSLTSSDPSIGPSDLVSYLVTGRPSADLSNPDFRRAAGILLPTLGAMGSQALRSQLGSFVDLFQIQSGSIDDQTSVGANGQGSNQFFDAIGKTRLGAEKQISDRLFLSVSTGLCALNLTNNATDESGKGLAGFGNAIEGKLEYRFPLVAPDRFALRFGREPAASALRCGQGSSGVRGFVQTPQQLGVSLFRSWSF